MRNDELVFVYGTLMSGYGNNRLLDLDNLICETTVNGSLWSVAPFPGYRREGEGVVHGELYWVDDDSMFHLDNLEGYFGDTDPNNMYNRIVTKVSHPEYKDHIVYIYEWNEPIDEIKYKYKEITTGNYRDFNYEEYIRDTRRVSNFGVR